MADSKRFEVDPSHSTIETELQNNRNHEPSENGGVPADTFPPFDDPANSSRPAGSPVQPTAPVYPVPPDDIEYAGHPDFSQDAASNKPPNDDMGLTRPLGETSEETRQSDAQGPSIASPPEEISKEDVEHRPL
jgi:hypothetical protein